MDEEGIKSGKNGGKPVLKTALKWGIVGFIVGVIMPFILGGWDIPIGIFPALFVSGLLETLGFTGIFRSIVYSNYVLLVNALVVGVFFCLASLIRHKGKKQKDE